MKVDGWILRHKDGSEANIGDKVTTFRGEECTLDGGQPPHKPGSTGRVYVQGPGVGGKYFPSVVDCRWEKIED